MFGLESIELFAIVAGLLAFMSFTGNMYLCCKLKLLRHKIDSIEKMGKLAQLEFPKLEAAADSKEEQDQIDIVSNLISSILDTAAETEKSGRRKTDKTSPFRSTPLGGRGSPF
ncbi:MAG: hypothetical protein JW947_05890 [Sedimentisphaerales bacterium]|nr:hypothetical protein [Sedimentisphaerales bacterium]